METMSCNDLRDLKHGGSFSFSCSESDLNFSSLSHFTDDDDADSISDGDDESYIEIALDHHHDHDNLKPTRDFDDEGDHVGDGFAVQPQLFSVGDLERADYLRISFSSSLLPELATHNMNNNNVSDHETPSFSAVSCPFRSSSMDDSRSGPLEGSYDHHDSSRLQRSSSARRRRLPAVNRLVNTLLFGPRSSSESPVHADSADLARSRKTSNIRSSINGGIMKLLFKFRAMNVGALVASIVKPRQVACDHDPLKANINGRRKNKKSKETNNALQYHQKLVKPFDKWQLVQKKQGTCYSSEVVGSEKYSKVLEINYLSTVKGFLKAIGNSMSSTGDGGAGRKERKTMSCPSSIKSSPLHQGLASESKVHLYARETSIQAAIAHCKTSFEQTSIS